jgi:N-methylhydantoinase A
MATRLGVDVGGTFTDLILYDDATGDVRVWKEPTVRAAPEQGVIRAVESTVPDAVLAGARYFLHGSTVGLNALLERRGAVVGLLTTEGFRDLLEIRRSDRTAGFDIYWKPPAPLVPRERRLEVRERVDADGSVHIGLDEAGVAAAAERFVADGVECVAICFLNAYANPEHELRAAQVLRDAGYTGGLALSHEVSGQYREYERTSTTVVDAYVRPPVSRYLQRLGDQLDGARFGGDKLLMRSGGGSMSFLAAEQRPHEAIQSGPVAGAEGAAELARLLGLDRVIAADVGGTSFDTSLIADGRAHLMYEATVVGFPVQTPWVDVRSIGAGGGSIAYLEAGRALRVGPRSAGADPGPACYGRGGAEPTVTDAALVLGMLGRGVLAGGLEMSRSAAVAALQRLAEALELDVGRVAQGIVRIASAAMANAIREITVERGEDPRRAALLAFGGAGPLFATLLARELGVRQIVIPPFAGNFSAWGMLGADVTRTSALTRILALDADGIREVDAVSRRLLDELREPGDDAATEVAVDARFVGQEHTLTIGWPEAATPDGVRRIFREAYLRTFGQVLEGTVELVTVRVTLRRALERRAIEPRPSRPGSAAGAVTLPAHSFHRGAELDFALIDREALGAGERFAGPAIVVEPTSTTYVDASFRGTVHETGALILSREEDD